MSAANNCNFIGRLVRDPELRMIPNSGKPVVNLTLAVEDEFNRDDSDKTLFIDGFTFGKGAETIANYCKKGKLFAMSGKLQPQHWEDQQTGKRQTKLKLFITGFKIIEWASNGNQGQQNNYQQQSTYQQNNQQNYQQQGQNNQNYQQQQQPQNDFGGFQPIDGDDDIPF